MHPLQSEPHEISNRHPSSWRPSDIINGKLKQEQGGSVSARLDLVELSADKGIGVFFKQLHEWSGLSTIETAVAWSTDSSTKAVSFAGSLTALGYKDLKKGFFAIGSKTRNGEDSEMLKTSLFVEDSEMVVAVKATFSVCIVADLDVKEKKQIVTEQDSPDRCFSPEPEATQVITVDGIIALALGPTTAHLKGEIGFDGDLSKSFGISYLTLKSYRVGLRINLLPPGAGIPQ